MDFICASTAEKEGACLYPHLWRYVSSHLHRHAVLATAFQIAVRASLILSVTRRDLLFERAKYRKI